MEESKEIEMITESQARRYLGITRKFFRSARSHGEFKSYRIGTKNYYNKSELVDWLTYRKPRNPQIAVYCRISSVHDPSLLEAQKKTIVEWCRIRSLTPQWYFEEVGPGTDEDWETRPKFLQLMELCSSGKIQTVIVESYDRISTLNWESWRKIFLFWGVQVWSCTTNLTREDFLIEIKSDWDWQWSWITNAIKEGSGLELIKNYTKPLGVESRARKANFKKTKRRIESGDLDLSDLF
jgi:predicted site-specific integrase-resolvase